MSLKGVAAALQRVELALQRHPQMGVHDDPPATARWQGGTRVETSHANGTAMLTDMPHTLGGSGDRVSPGWLMRASLASCTATRIAMQAATEAIELEVLEVVAGSRSDTRGLLGMEDADGKAVDPGPNEVRLHVRIAARGVTADQLRTLVEESQRSSPVHSALCNPVHVVLHVDIEPAR